MNHLEIPSGSGSYRWYYVDVTSGPCTAVFIFMLGSVFSPRYASSLRRGGVPREHAAVNFALYQHGKRTLWALSEYGGATLGEGGASLRIGTSTLRYTPTGLQAELRDRTAPFLLTQWGTPLEVQLELTAEGPALEEVRLVEGLSHHWQPISPRAHATVRIPHLGLTLTGRAYHDTNHGLVPLGSDLRGWEWVRTHGEDETGIVYRPWGGAPAILASISASGARVARAPLPAPLSRRSSWGLRVPCSLGLAGPPTLMESSPFYARAEAIDGAAHALGEVADFARFRRAPVRWMAHFRTRAGGSA